MLLTKHFQLSGYPEHKEGMPFLPSLWEVGFRTNSSQQGASRGAGAFSCCCRALAISACLWFGAGQHATWRLHQPGSLSDWGTKSPHQQARGHVMWVRRQSLVARHWDTGGCSLRCSLTCPDRSSAPKQTVVLAESLGGP